MLLGLSLGGVGLLEYSVRLSVFRLGVLGLEVEVEVVGVPLPFTFTPFSILRLYVIFNTMTKLFWWW